MKNRVTVNRVQNGWAVIDHQTQIGDLHDSEQSAQLHAHHYRHAPSAFKKLGLKKVDGIYTGNPFYGVKVSLYKNIDGDWTVVANITNYSDTGEDISKAESFPTREKACQSILKLAALPITMTTIFGKEFETTRGSAGTATCPSRESYWCA